MVRDRDETETFDFQSETRSRPRPSHISTRRDRDIWKLRLETVSRPRRRDQDDIPEMITKLTKQCDVFQCNSISVKIQQLNLTKRKRKLLHGCPKVPTTYSITISSLVEHPYKPQIIFTARRNARIASAVLATEIPSVCLSVCPSVCPSVRHTPVLCQNDGT